MKSTKEIPGCFTLSPIIVETEDGVVMVCSVSKRFALLVLRKCNAVMLPPNEKNRWAAVSYLLRGNFSKYVEHGAGAVLVVNRNVGLTFTRSEVKNRVVPPVLLVTKKSADNGFFNI